MAKRSSRSFKTRRDASVIASDPRELLASLSPLRSGRGLSVLEDRRLFHPGVRPLRTSRQVARVVMRPPLNRSKSRSHILRGPEVHAFQIPRSTLVCVRRSIRKEVLHAKKRVGSGNRRPRRTGISRISCKRS